MSVDVKFYPNGKFVVAYNSTSAIDSAYLKKYLSNGAPDLSYGVNGVCSLHPSQSQTIISSMKMYNNILYVCGRTNNGTKFLPFIAAVDSVEQTVNTFGTNGYVTLTNYIFGNDIEIDTVGNIYLSASSGYYNSSNQFITSQHVLKLTNNGSIDNTFGNNGATTIFPINPNTGFTFDDISFDNSNKILLCGYEYSSITFTNVTAAIARIDLNGQMDNSFATSGIGIYKYASNSTEAGVRILQDSNNDYLICGTMYSGASQDCFILKTNNSGTINTSYMNNGWGVYDLMNVSNTDFLQNALLLSDGRLLMCGSTYNSTTSIGNFSLFAVLPNGTPDNRFAGNGVFVTAFNTNNNSSALGMDINQNGEVVLSGFTRTCSGGICGPHYLAISKYLNFIQFVGLAENDADEKFISYPNPASDYIKISGIKNIKSISVMDIAGKLVKTLAASEIYNNIVSLQELEQGIYIMSVKDTKGNSFTKKFCHIN